MGYKVNIFIVAVFAILYSVSVCAQSKRLDPKKRICMEYGFSVQGYEAGSSAPFPSKLQDDRSRYSVHAQFIYAFNPGFGVGVELSSAPRTYSIETLSLENNRVLDYFGVVFSGTSRLRNNHFFLKTDASIGYAYVNHKLKKWVNNYSDDIQANGIGTSLRLTLGYKVSERRALGLQFGLSMMSFGKWNASEKLNDNLLYNGGLFGDKSSSMLTPSIGLVLTNPLGR